MKFRDYVAVIRKRWLVLVLVTVAGTAVGAGISYTSEKQYTATAQVYFQVQSGGTAADLSQSQNTALSQMSTFASFATLPVVLQPVIDQLKLDRTPNDLAGSIKAVAPSNTTILPIEVTDPDPAQAATIANAVAQQVGTFATDRSVRTSQNKPSVVAQTVAQAVTPNFASSPKTKQNVIAGFLAGVLLGFLLALARDRLDTRIRNREDVESASDVPCIGQLWSDRRMTKGFVPVMVSEPAGTLAEAIRSVRTSLQYFRVDGKPLVAMVTSAVPGEGKTTTALNLALALAETEARVLLIDADLRRPTVASGLQLENAAGLTSILIGEASFDDVVQPWGESGLDVLPAGVVPPNPTTLLGSQTMLDVIEYVTSRYDYVLLDTAPLLAVTDTSVLAMAGIGSIHVVAAGESRKDQVRDSMASVERLGGRPLGFILNKLAPRSVQRRQYGYEPVGQPAPVQGSRGTIAGTVPVNRTERRDPAPSPAVAAGRPDTAGPSTATSDPVAGGSAAEQDADVRGRSSDPGHPLQLEKVVHRMDDATQELPRLPLLDSDDEPDWFERSGAGRHGSGRRRR
jgi:polysaccharide biosynthesis transport protein